MFIVECLAVSESGRRKVADLFDFFREFCDFAIVFRGNFARSLCGLTEFSSEGVKVLRIRDLRSRWILPECVIVKS